MTKNLLLACLAAGWAYLAMSCSRQDADIPDNVSPGSRFHARIESPDDPETKVYADDKLHVLWDADDRVSIFHQYTYNQEYRFTGETGDREGSFDIVPNDDFVTGNELDLVYAVYPYQESTRVDNGGVLTVTLPSVQTFRENSFGPEANTMVSCTADDPLYFKNLCGYLALRLYGEDVSISAISIRGNQGEPLAGEATVVSEPGGNPSCTLSDGAATEITLTMAEPVRLGSTASDATTFWLVIPPVTFREGFTVSITDRNGGTVEKATTRSISISRNTLSRMSALRVYSESWAEGDYVDEYGVNHGQGITVDGITWAPVNCGYKPVTAVSKGYPYGKLYQWGRKHGQGYGAPYLNSGDSNEDETIPVLAQQWTGKNEDADPGTFYYGIPNTFNWISSFDCFWNKGTEAEPEKNDLYDPCPEGWRVPTATELSTLATGNHSSLTVVDGILGFWFSGSTVYRETLSDKVFLPASGGRFADNYYHHNGASGRGEGGSYWGATLKGNDAMNMNLDGSVSPTYRAFGFAVRCVREEVQPFVPVSSISLDRQEMTLTVGGSETLLATVAPDTASDKTVLWTSDAPAVATVDGNGAVTALKAGTATITAMSQSGGLTATCSVTVVDAGLSVKALFSGIDLSSGGSFSYESPYWKMTAGANLTVAIQNTGSGSITVTGLRLICAKTGTPTVVSIDRQTLSGGEQQSHTVTLSGTLYSPTLEYTYLYEGNSSIVSTPFTGAFDTATTEPYPFDPFDPGFN